MALTKYTAEQRTAIKNFLQDEIMFHSALAYVEPDDLAEISEAYQDYPEYCYVIERGKEIVKLINEMENA